MPGKLEQVEKVLVPGNHAQITVDGEEALVDALERRVKDGRPCGELGLPVAKLVQDAFEVGRHAVESFHGGGDLHELVGGMRTEKSPRPKRAALSASARTGVRPRLTIAYVVAKSVTSRSAVIVTAARTSVQSSASSGTEDGVTASTA